ncbi:MAG: prephenate dehydratase [Deltaproteobacteria bacterium]|nr:prephenate dehydratase [Deltaproteobacteria bacterium]
MSKEKLTRLRRAIDRIDQKILSLLNDRARIVQKIGSFKKETSDEFYSPNREKKILERLKSLNKGPFPNHAVPVVFKEIFSASLAMQAPMKVAYLGPAATFTHVAALRHFGRSAELVPQGSIAKVFEEVEHSRAEFGVVGIENSTEGVVGQTLDQFLSATLKISAEITLPISHHLMARASLRSGEIRRIYSHPQAVGQCREWLEENCPDAMIREVESTAAAAQRAAEEKGSAAIASEYAAELYNLKILKRSIEDHPNNFTRFLVIGRKVMSPSGHDKTSLLFSVKDEPGILYKMLEPFSRAGINLTKIESRPLARLKSGRLPLGKWEYIFFLDIEGHQKETKIQKAIRALELKCHFLKVLGSYPKSS